MTIDGSEVEIYRRWPATDDVEAVNALLEPDSSVLDLGAGAGRIADGLAALGHRVTAVDESSAMLSHVRRARTVQARIEQLALPEKFDAVMLASNLVNYRGIELRRALLAGVARHVSETGTAIFQWSPPGWFATRPPGDYHKEMGSMSATLTIHSNHDGVVIGELVLRTGDRHWRQPVELEQLTLAELRSELNRAGLELDDPGTAEDSVWFTASPLTARRTSPSRSARADEPQLCP